MKLSRMQILIGVLLGSVGGTIGFSAVQSAASGQDTSSAANLNASNLRSGIVPDARLAANVARLDAPEIIFNPGDLGAGTNARWIFKTASDDAIATLMVSSEGTTVGATPHGFAQLQVNAQDEVPRPQGPPVGSNMNGYFRVASKTFNGGACLNTLCPDTAELLSTASLRLTASGEGTLTLGRSSSTALSLDTDGSMKVYAPLWGIDARGQQAFQLGALGLEIGGDPDLYSPPRYAPNDAMSSPRWVPGSLRVASRLGVGCHVDGPFGGSVAGETKTQAALCVQPLKSDVKLGAYLSTPVGFNLANEGVTAAWVTTKDTANDGRNIGVAIAGGNRGRGGATSLSVLPSATDGIDIGISVEAEPGVEHPLSVRTNGTDTLLVCGDGGMLVGLDCAKSRGVGTINISGDLYKNGAAFNNADYVFERFYTGEIRNASDVPGALTYPGLLGLSELEAFAKANHQLPRVAQARGVFERQDAMLASLEEAYLHIFELNRRIDQLSAQLAAVERRVR